MPTRVVVLGDVVASRDVEDRDALRERLVAACADVNESHADDLAAGFALLKGVDEFAGVLHTPAPTYDAVDAFARHVHPEEVRFAVARGDVDVAPESGDVRRMDGPAFHRADELATDVAGTPFRFAMDLDDPPLDETLADEINLLLVRKADWTPRQRRAAARYRELGSQRAVADELGISQPAVSQALARANYRLVRDIEDRLRHTLARYE